MARNWTRWVGGAVGVAVGVAGGALWRWKHRRLAELAAGSELVETDRGTVEVARRGSGYPVLVLHGAPGGYDQVVSFADAHGDVEVIAPSRPGYLRTPLGDARSPGGQAALFVALLDELGIERAIVVGLSSGGPAALHLAAAYPDRVAGVLLLCAITTDIDDRTFDTGNPLLDPILTSTPVLDVYSGLFVLLRRFRPERLVALAHEAFSTLEGAALDAYVASVVADPDHRERDLALVSSLFPVSPRLEGTLNDEHWFRRLPRVDFERIDCPVMLVHGEYDAAVPITHAEFAAERLPDADLVRVRADHFVMTGPDADGAVCAVQTFIDRLTTPPEPATR
jgi:pimeloyl-ACP methyl ester carboxylesterase